LRKIIRRLFFFSVLLNYASFNSWSKNEKDINKIVEFIQDWWWRVGLGKPYVASVVNNIEWLKDKNLVIKTIADEFETFKKTLVSWLKLLRNIIIHMWSVWIVSGLDSFKLYDTYGFPIELTKEISSIYNLTIDEQSFNKEMEKQRERSRQWSKDMFTQDVDRSKYLAWIPPTKFVWYDTLALEKMKLLKDFIVAWKRILIFDATPFYAESWGQASDRGIVVLDNWEVLHISEVKKYEGIFLHFVK
jgi:alanyl-tRNA synthetase